MSALATPQGTRALAQRHETALAPGHYRALQDLTVSSIGLGTYLGEHDKETDELYRDAVIHAVRRGLNLIDTAINYRCMRSERAIGDALGKLFAAGDASREEVVVATKGGFIPFDGAPPRDPAAYFRDTYLATGLARAEDVAAGCHCMAPRYLQSQIEKSLENLGLDAVDVYFLHNPETQLGEVPREEFERRLCRAFEVLEDSAARGRIRYYGTATWQAYRASPEAPEYLSLARVVALARDVGGEGHRFRVIQLPYNLAMAEAFGLANQEVGGEKVTLLEAAARLGISVVASVPLYQARLARGLPPDLRRSLGLDTDAQRAIQFVRSTPGITAPLVGMKRRAHLEENLEVSKAPPIAPEQIASLFRSA